MEETESRTLAPLTSTEVSQITKQLGLATSAESTRTMNGVGMVLKKISELEAQLVNMQKDASMNNVRMYPTKSEETDVLARATSIAKIAGLKDLVATGNLNGKSYYMLEDLIKAYAQPLFDNNLTIDFFMDQRNGVWVLVSRIEHDTSKQWKETSAELNDSPVTSRMNDDQALSSSLTYKKRDAYRLLLGI